MPKISDKTIYCGAQAWRTFTYEGFLVTTKYTVSQVTCTFEQGHEGKHAGWLTFQTGRGSVQAKVMW